MKIVGLQKLSLLDYPDLIAATVFLAGCNMNCGYCYNRWMIDESKVGEIMSIEEFIAWLGKRVGLLDGICVCGGEPAIHPDLADLLRPIKEMGFRIKLDTNGSNPALVATLFDQDLVDYVALDIKAPFDRRYHAVAGCIVDLEAIRRTLALVRSKAPSYELRTTAGPLTTEQDLVDIASMVRPGESYYLQPFQREDAVLPSMHDAEALSEDELHAIAKEIHAEVR